MRCRAPPTTAFTTWTGWSAWCSATSPPSTSSRRPTEMLAESRSPTMKDELEQLLKSLHLKCVLELFEDEAKRAEKQKLSYQEFCCRLFRAQWQRNQETALAYRIKQARM